MKKELDEFHKEIFQEIQRNADSEGQFAEDAFFELFTGHLVDAGDLEAADRAFYQSPRGLRVDGYGGDPAGSEGILSLVVCDFRQSPEVESLTGTEMDAAFKRATNFLIRSLDASFRATLEETSAGFGLADLIASCWGGTRKVKVFLLTNAVLSARVDGRPAGEVAGVPVVYSVWDLGRLYRFTSSGRAREELVVDLADHGGPVTALPAHLADAAYEAYLLVMPASQLASIYDRWGARLLEQNVRVFLQAKGQVNKGIRNTIENSPEMFFAYNNGITATAEEVIGESSRAGFRIARLRNLQIVNGGQTTASIYAASQKPGMALDRIFVQVKLSVISSGLAETVVPKISEYANSQNKVNAADFFANHPFHVRLKEFSERIFAPSRDGTFRESKWFYERARGQYQDRRNSLSVADRRRFDLEFPKAQLFTKTDLAKFLFVWMELPHVVSKGAQKNFAEFATHIGKAWDSRPDDFNEAYFRECVAKAVIFKETELLVTKQPWYGGGYRAQIVAYTIAKLAADVVKSGRAVDFEAIWKAQRLSPVFREALSTVASDVKDVLESPPPGARNVTEWAKQQACWTRVAALPARLPREFEDCLVSLEEKKQGARIAIREQRVLNGIEAQLAVVNAGGAVWRLIRDWGAHRRLLSQKDLDILDVAAGIPNRVPSEKQSVIALRALEKLRAEGCPIGNEIRW